MLDSGREGTRGSESELCDRKVAIGLNQVQNDSPARKKKRGGGE